MFEQARSIVLWLRHEWVVRNWTRYKNEIVFGFTNLAGPVRDELQLSNQLLVISLTKALIRASLK